MKNPRALIYVLNSLMMAINIFMPGCRSTHSDHDYKGYLFTYFTGNGPGEEAIRYAVSTDGYHFHSLNQNKPILDSREISSSGGVRDPHILRGTADGTFYMVATDLYVPEMGWKNYALVLMKSTDLIQWDHSVVNIPESFPETYGNVWRVWAPQSIYDEKEERYMIYFSMKQGEDPDKIYYAYSNEDFTALEGPPKQLFFSPTNNACIDGDIVFHDGVYHLFMKSEDGEPGIKLAVSDKLTEGYELISQERVDEEILPVEGSGIFKLNDSDDFILMYDLYTQGRYQFTRSSDLRHFKVIDEEISMNFKPRHGTVMPITTDELKGLIKEYAGFNDILAAAESPFLRKNNVGINGNYRKIRLPVRPGASLSAFDPGITTFPGIEYEPSGAQDFSGGAVDYTFNLEGKGEVVYEVTVTEDHNPVLEGYYADPDILYARKTGKYYLYPTSDGFHNWSGTYFKVFSSEDLITWTDDGIILDLKKDVEWADRNAWAPCIIEKEVSGTFTYYFYFTAAQKIGVAVANDPAGPYTDIGHPLVDFKPQGITNGQEIDPDVFTDPASGKSYLYWGNGYMAVAELNDDMVSLKNETLQILTPDETYREGTYVFFRNGLYYFLWSEDDTRSPNYRVRYATSPTPVGPLSIPDINLVIEKDETTGIFGTGHNSILQIPGEDEWYIVYHRFSFPKGINMGRSAGFHREVCIDRLTFDDDGSILPVKPTLEGINGI